MDTVEHRHGYQNAIHCRAQSDHIAIFDERTGMLLTGDTVYSGNLYIRLTVRLFLLGFKNL